MHEKVCLITGATSGIGYVTALELAKMGATVVIGGRDMEKTANVAIKIRSESNNPNVDFLLADLSNFAETRQFASEFCKQYTKLDVLVNNAGAIFKEYDENPDRIEMTMALNFFSPYLLTGLLLEKMQAAEKARIINVSSMMHQMASNQYANFNIETNYKPLGAYALSKLALMHFTYSLAEKLKGTGISVNAMHPGWVKSNFGSDFYTGFYGVINTVFKPIQSTPEHGASTIVYLASSPEVENTTGKYFIKRKATGSSSASYDRSTANYLWDLAQSTCKFHYQFGQKENSQSQIETGEKKADGGPSEDNSDK
jgi:NAD(P)-dependent dehydrogenase (short-subunit alcohol dehydrogenase family)